MTVLVVIAILIAYFIGSISSAILTCQLMKLPDPRTQGSNNPGATNVLRIGGKKAAIITLIGDVLKGVLPVVIARALNFDAVSLSCIAFAAFLGHLYPVYFRFVGGKGVATAFGCLIALNIYLGLALIATWLIVAIIFRYSSLAAIVTACLAPFYAFFLTNMNYAIMCIAMSGLLIYRHRENIHKLRAGLEKKF